MTHGKTHLHGFVAHVFAIALVSFFGAMAAGAWRANRIILRERIAAIGVSLAIIYGLPDLNGRVVVAAVIGVFIVSFIAEHLRFRDLRNQALRSLC